jgi:hypothetical protein
VLGIGLGGLAWQYDTVMTEAVVTWWCTLCTVAAFNIVAWSWSAFALRRGKAGLSTELYKARRLQLQLSAVYVFGCAYRSIFPVFDIPRVCLVDSWLSSVIVGRSVATVAELCFVAQWAALLREGARATGSIVARFASRTVLPLIGIAETCSWYSVLTTDNIGHTAEESLWGISAALFLAGIAVMGSRSARDRRPLLLLWGVAAAAYVGFMYLVDVPMYWSRWLADEAIGRHYLSVLQGIHDVAVRRVVSHSWLEWKTEMPWMSLYFSVAVWISISLIHAPSFRSSRMAARASASPRWRYVFSWTNGN